MTRRVIRARAQVAAFIYFGMILRPGGVTREQIEAVIGEVDLFTGSIMADQAASSPGQQEQHYSPITPAYGFEGKRRSEVIGDLRTSNQRVVVMAIGGNSDSEIEMIKMPSVPTKA